MVVFSPEPPFEPNRAPPVGILVVNLGTPDEPTTRALRRYLKQFLWDRRVVERPRVRWWLVLHLFVLTTRPRKSAALYRKIWTRDGSPLLVLASRLRDALERELRTIPGTPVEVALGMRYGSPSIRDGLARLRERGCDRLLCVPLFPQYSATTTASALDALFDELSRWRVIPELRTVADYHDNPRYIAAVAGSIEERWYADSQPDTLLFSFHGIPLRYAEAGDPYPQRCRETARRIAERLGLAPSRWEVAFQSIFGRERWVEPTTARRVVELARAGVSRLDVVCPGFSIDCLETIEEIDQLNRGLFVDAGGEQFRYVPCLNDRAEHVELIASLVRRHADDWIFRPAR